MSGWAITAASLVSPVGDVAAAVYESVAAGRPPDAGSGEYPAVRIADFDARRYVQRKGLKLLSRTSQLACAAAAGLREALPAGAGERVGVVFGTAWASLDSVVRFEREAHVDGARFVDPILFTETVANVPAGQISIYYGWSAINATVSGGSAAGLMALERATEFLDEQRADVVVAGGGDELNEHLLRTLHAERVESGEAAAVVGAEAVCLFALEHASAASARGAAVPGRIVSVASCFVRDDDDEADASRERFVREVIDRAGWKVDDVDLLVLSGNGLLPNGRAERAILGRLYASSGPPAVLPRSVLGEYWGASGPIGVVLALESMRRSAIPGRASGLPESIEGSAVRLPEKTVAAEVRRALVIECGGQGQLAALALERGA